MRLLARLKRWDWLPNGKRTAFFGILNSRQDQPERYQADLLELAALVQDGKLKPLVHATLPIDQIAHAHTLLEGWKVAGNLIITGDQ